MKPVRLLITVLLWLVAPQSAFAGGLNADWLQMTPRATSPVPFAYGGLYTSSITGRPTLVDSSGHSFTIGVGSSWVASAGPPSGAVIGDCWRDTTAGNRVYCKESSGVVAQRADVASPGSFGSGAANLVLAGPASGGSGPVTLRALVAADLTGVLGGIYQPLDGDLTAIAGLSSTGYLVRTSSNTWALRSLVAGAGISLTDNDGVGAGTTITLSLPSVGPGAGTVAYPDSITLDAQGRVAFVTAGSAPLALSSSTPAPVGSAAVGVGTTAARSDHVHAHGNQAGGSLHSDVVAAGASGFMSGADKTKLDGISNGATNLALSSTTPAAIGTAAVGVGTTAARSDHVHALPGGGATLPEANGGFGASIAGIGTGIIVRSAANTPLARSIAAGTGTTVTNGDGVGGNPQVNVTYGTGSNTAAQGNDSRIPPTPTAANKLLYDTGSAYAETATCSSASTVLVGGSPPACAAVPDAALSANIVTLTGSQILTNKTFNCADNSCTVRLGSDVSGTLPKANGGFGQSVASGLTFGQGVYVDSSGVLQIGNVPFEFNLSFYGGTTTNEYAIYPGNGATIQLSAVGTPLFQSVAAGTCFLLTAQSDTPSSGTVTYRLRKSTNKGGSWSDLSTSVTCSYTNGTTTCSDTTNLGVIAAGDWIQPTVQWTVSNGLGYFGGVRFKCRYN